MRRLSHFMIAAVWHTRRAGNKQFNNSRYSNFISNYHNWHPTHTRDMTHGTQIVFNAPLSDTFVSLFIAAETIHSSSRSSSSRAGHSTPRRTSRHHHHHHHNHHQQQQRWHRWAGGERGDTACVLLESEGWRDTPDCLTTVPPAARQPRRPLRDLWKRCKNQDGKCIECSLLDTTIHTHTLAAFGRSCAL